VQPYQYKEVVNNYEKIELSKLPTQTQTLPDVTNEPVENITERTETINVPGKEIYSTKYYQPSLRNVSYNVNLLKG